MYYQLMIDPSIISEFHSDDSSVWNSSEAIPEERYVGWGKLGANYSNSFTLLQ